MALYSLPSLNDLETRFSTVKSRLQTFADWESEFDPRELAYEGFYYLDNQIVACYTCHLKLYQFESVHQDTVDVLHRQYSPQCPVSWKDVFGRKPMWRVYFDVE